jgi:hypothetical protein
VGGAELKRTELYHRVQLYGTIRLPAAPVVQVPPLDGINPGSRDQRREDAHLPDLMKSCYAISATGLPA